MASPEKLLNLKIHKMSTQSYNEALEAGSLDSSALYLTPATELVGANQISVTEDTETNKITFNVADGTTSQKGIVQLYDDVNSTDATKAATANAVKTAYDKGVEALEAAGHTHPYAGADHNHGNIDKDGKLLGSDGGVEKGAILVTTDGTDGGHIIADPSISTSDLSTLIGMADYVKEKNSTIKVSLESLQDQLDIIGTDFSEHNHNNDYAPINHAGTGTDYAYGLGTTSNFGHVKLNNGQLSTPGIDGHADGVAAGLGHTHSIYALSEHNHGRITRDGTFNGDAAVAKVVITNNSGAIMPSDVITIDKLNHLSKVTSDIQDQLDDKLATDGTAGTAETVRAHTVYVYNDNNNKFNYNYPIALFSTTPFTDEAKGDFDSLYKDLNGFTYNPSTGIVTAQAYNALSDRRLKENLVVYEPEKSILDLPIYSFNFKNNPDKTQIGCMAQDLQELFPELVTEGSDGYLSISENKLVYLLLLELKKMKSKLTEACIM